MKYTSQELLYGENNNFILELIPMSTTVPDYCLSQQWVFECKLIFLAQALFLQEGKFIIFLKSTNFFLILKNFNFNLKKKSNFTKYLKHKKVSKFLSKEICFYSFTGFRHFWFYVFSFFWFYFFSGRNG